MDASSRNAAALSTVTLTLPPDVLSEQSPVIGPVKPARMLPPLVLARSAPSTASMRIPPPDVLISASPPTTPAAMLPPDVCKFTAPRALSSVTPPPDVRASTAAPILPSLISPPDVRAFTLPARSPTVMPPPDVRRSVAKLAGTETMKSTVTGGHAPT